ncbi:MAG: HAMP domain-containing histidine kinase [Nanoarchaeota archaeon]|nr:HAMP domain-containing histidine kinase [Nanoarchaeota archaeon]MBU1704187.1 HAMP domain-containing histidine kinase [Nanoarchaeota archaeon]
MSGQPSIDDLLETISSLSQTIMEMQHDANIGREIRSVASVVIHDFGYLLSAIEGSAELLMDQEPNGSYRYNTAKGILNATKGLKEMRDCLMLALRGRPKRYLEICSITDLFDEDEMIYERVKLHGCYLAKEYAEDLYQVKVEKEHIRNAYENMVINAVQSMVPGGTVTVRVYNHDGKLDNLDSCKFVRIEIEDEGKGIDQEILPRIFEPFFSAKDEYGTGLGLTIVYQAVKDHNGKIDVESELGKGTKFTIYLPAYLG